MRRRGGFFCFGQNLLFREVLRAIGFRCYSTAARVNGEHATSEKVCEYSSPRLADLRGLAEREHRQRSAPSITCAYLSRSSRTGRNKTKTISISSMLDSVL